MSGVQGQFSQSIRVMDKSHNTPLSSGRVNILWHAGGLQWSPAVYVCHYFDFCKFP
jgi:hypothetical protein